MASHTKKWTTRRITYWIILATVLVGTYHERALLMRPKIAMSLAIVKITPDSELTPVPMIWVKMQAMDYLVNKVDPFKNRDASLSMLHSGDPYTRIIAMNNIGFHMPVKLNTTDPFYVRLVELAQHDPDLDARTLAISTLGVTRDKQVCGLLGGMYIARTPEGLGISESDSVEFRERLASSLKKLDCPNAAEILKPRDISVLMNIMAGKYPNGYYVDSSADQDEAEEELGKVDLAIHYKEFIPYLDNRNPALRWLAITYLAKTKKYEAFEPIAKSLHTDPIADVRYVATRELGNLGDRRACPVLAQVLIKKSFGDSIPGDPYPVDADNIHDEAKKAMTKLHCQQVKQ